MNYESSGTRIFFPREMDEWHAFDWDSGKTLWALLLQKETQTWKPSINIWGQDWREGGKVTTDNTNLKIPICSIIINNMAVNFYNAYIFLCNVKADTSPIFISTFILAFWEKHRISWSFLYSNKPAVVITILQMNRLHLHMCKWCACYRHRINNSLEMPEMAGQQCRFDL